MARLIFLDLPAHQIEAAARAWAKLEGTKWDSITPAGKAGMIEVTEAMIRAFLNSDDKEDK